MKTFWDKMRRKSKQTIFFVCKFLSLKMGIGVNKLARNATMRNMDSNDQPLLRPRDMMSGSKRSSSDKK